MNFQLSIAGRTRKRRPAPGVYLAIVVLLLALLAGCSKNDADGARERGQKSRELAVFIPGVLAGSPTYEMLASGVKKAAGEAGGVNVTVIEAGYNQADWETKLTAMAAQEKYDLIISSNPSIPVIADSVSRKFPNARFMILDGKLAGNPAIYTLSYNQSEEAYTLGYLAGLLTAEAGLSPVQIGLIAAQHYPVMDEVIEPAYLKGANDALGVGEGGGAGGSGGAGGAAVATGAGGSGSGSNGAGGAAEASVDFRIVGSWDDADKARELAESMYKGNIKVILPIAGSAGEGVVQAAVENNGKVLWFDVNAYKDKPGIIVGCAVLEQEKAAYNKTLLFLQGKLPFGSAESVGIADSYVDFADKDPLYIQNVSQSVYEKQEAMLKKLRE